MKIVDTNTELEKHIQQLNVDQVLVYPIMSSLTQHSVRNRISAIILSDGELDLFVNYHNIDADGITSKIDFNGFKLVWVVGLKEFLHQTDYTDNMYDLELELFHKATQYEIAEKPIYTVFRRRKAPKANDLIPIWKHYDQFLDWKRLLVNITSDYSKMGGLYPYVFNWLERGGIYTTTGMEFTHYNLLTTTSRPSNTFNGVNYAALNKRDNTRMRFVSRFDGGKLIQFDFDGYHIRLISELIDEKIPLDVKAHQWLADQYGVSKDEAKPITFRQLYGGVQDEYKHIPFFQKVSKYIEDIWFDYLMDKVTYTPIFKRKIEYDKEMNKNKLFNYILQAFETEKNIYIINKLQYSGLFKRSLPVLYTYDSILFDVHPDDVNIIPKIKEIMEWGGYPTEIEAGINYKDMVKVKL